MLVGILSILAAAGLTLVDQLIKLWATVELLPVGSKPFIPHVLEFYYLLNDGMSFSMLSGKRTLLVIITGVMIEMSMRQNFVPVVDDEGIFIGIIRRRDIIQYCYQKSGIKEEEEARRSARKQNAEQMILQ